MAIEITHLVTVGCSFTFCQALYDPPNEGWPRLLANKLGVPVVNLGECGSSNDGIARRTYNYFYKNLPTNSKPLFVVAMSQSIRREEYFAEYDQDSGFGLEQINDYHGLMVGGGKNLVDKAVFEQMNEIGVYKSQERKLRLWASIINLFKANNIPYVISDYFPDKSEETELYIKLNYPELNKYINMDNNKLQNFNDITYGYPKAMDKAHDGPDAQIVLADYIYKQLLNRHKKIIPIKDAKFLSLKDFPVSHKRIFEQMNKWYRHEMGLEYTYGLN
jgi:hypothetical protein